MVFDIEIKKITGENIFNLFPKLFNCACSSGNIYRTKVVKKTNIAY